MKELKIDPELRDLLPPLTDDEYKQLEKNIRENGFDNNFPIMEWHGFIVDGHNRYAICKKNNIEFIVGTLAYETKDEVMEWMLDVQLGRRNLSPIQRIAVAEKYRGIYEKQAKENKRLSGVNFGIGINEKVLVNLPKPIAPLHTSQKLASIAGVSEKTYRMGAKVLNSDKESLKREVISGKKSISAAYKVLTKPKEAALPVKEVIDQDYDLKEQISESILEMKTPKKIDDYWNFMNEVECMEEDFEQVIDSTHSRFFEIHNLNNKITKEEKDIAISSITMIIEKMNEIKEKILRVDEKEN